MKKFVLSLLVVLSIGGLAFWIAPRLTNFLGMSQPSTNSSYYCPMHPSYVSDRPGDCPICNMRLVPKKSADKKERRVLYYRHPMGQPDTSPVPKKDPMGMDYIPVYEGEAPVESKVPGHAMLHLSPEKQERIGIKGEIVKKRKLQKQIRTVGRVAYDPELYTAQREYLLTLESIQKAEASPYHGGPERAKALLESAKVRLRLLGMSEDEISRLESETGQDRNLILPGGEEGRFVWVYASIYEYELPYAPIGTPVKVKVPTFPDKEFMGEVQALDPVLDPATRAIRIRARIPDPESLLRPEMYVDIYLESDLGEKIAVPEEAVMHTGEKTLVFIKNEQGLFEPREITLGAKAGKFYEAAGGLHEGEWVVTSGNFLIDSESRLQAAFENMSGAHQHGT